MNLDLIYLDYLACKIHPLINFAKMWALIVDVADVVAGTVVAAADDGISAVAETVIAAAVIVAVYWHWYYQYFRYSQYCLYSNYSMDSSLRKTDEKNERNKKKKNPLIIIQEKLIFFTFLYHFNIILSFFCRNYNMID